MSAHIEVTGSATRLNGHLRQFVDRLQAIQDDADQLKAVFDQAALGGDFAGLGSALGIDADSAEIVYNLFGSVNTELNAAFINQLLARLG